MKELVMRMILVCVALISYWKTVSAGIYDQLLPRFAPPSERSPNESIRMLMNKHREDFTACIGNLNNSDSQAGAYSGVTAVSGDIIFGWKSSDKGGVWAVKRSSYRGEPIESCLLRELKKLNISSDRGEGFIQFAIDCRLDSVHQTLRFERIARKYTLTWS